MIQCKQTWYDIFKKWRLTLPIYSSRNGPCLPYDYRFDCIHKPTIAFPLFAHRPEALVAHRPRPQMRRLRCDDDDDDDPRMWVALSPLRRQSQAATSSHRLTPRRSHVENSRSRSRGRQRGARSQPLVLSFIDPRLQIGSGCSVVGLSVKYNKHRLRNLYTWKFQDFKRSKQ